MSYLVLDLETGTKEYLGRKANYLVNNIVAIGLAKNKQAEAIYYDESEKLASWWSYLITTKVLVVFNAAFDLLYLWKYKEFQEWLKQGGRIYDPQLAEYMLSGQLHKYPALRDIAVNKYGCKEREKLMEQHWEQGIDTKDILKELVLEDVKNDVLDTEEVMLKQVALAKKEGMYRLIMERMDGLLATISMEYNGMFINQDIFNQNKRNIESLIHELHQKVNKISEEYYK